jgi:hypothetical protein
MIDLSNNPLMLMCMGVFTLLIGLAIVVSHSIYKGWPILVTLMGYLVTLKGIMLLFFPESAIHIVMFWKEQNMILAPMPSLLFGVVLLYFGFSRKAG